MKSFLLILVCAMEVWAQPGIARPLLGIVRDSRGAVRPVYGVPGNFVVGASLWDGAQSAAFSGYSGMIKSASELVIVDRRGQKVRSWPAPDGPALFGFDNTGAAALVYFPGPRILWRVGGDSPETIDTTRVDGDVLSLSAGGHHHIRIAVRRDGALHLLRLSASGDGLSDEVVCDDALAAGFADSEVLAVATRDGLLTRAADGSESLVPLEQPATSIDRMGEGWLLVGQPDGAQPIAWHYASQQQDLFRVPASAETQE